MKGQEGRKRKKFYLDLFCTQSLGIGIPIGGQYGRFDVGGRVD